MKKILLITLVSLAFLFVSPGLTLAQLGSISGGIIDEGTGLPIIGAYVWAMGDSSQPGGYGWGTTDSTGFYRIDSLRAGAFLVSAYAYGYQSETYPDSVIVVDGENTPNIDFGLTFIGGSEYSSISGRVTDEETGLPIIGAHLMSIGLDNWCYGEGWSDTSGYYTIQYLCPGIYQVNVHVTGYFPETFPDSVMVVDRENTPDIDFALTPIHGGDVNGDGGVNISDAICLANYILKGESAPIAPIVANVNCDGQIDLGDVIYLANYLFKGGSSPCWSPPEITVNFGSCKTAQKATILDSIPSDKDCIEYQYDGENVFSIKHINAGFNCCADEIRAMVSIQGSIITIEEREYFSVGPCYCLCLFDLDYSLGGVSPGEYTIRFIEPYLPEGDQVLEFIIDLSSSTSGSHCVDRSAYPWGTW